MQQAQWASLPASWCKQALKRVEAFALSRKAAGGTAPAQKWNFSTMQEMLSLLPRP